MSADEDSPLPAHILKALNAVVNGSGRVATSAHPDCICYKRIGTQTLPKWLWENPDVPEEGPVFGQRRDCPQHKP